MIVFIATVSLLVSVLQQGNCGKVCQTPACLNSAAKVTETMSVDPCDDFYAFACRGFINKNPIPPNQHAISMPILIEKEIQMKLRKILDAPDSAGDGKPIKLARAFYRTCMDEGSVKKLGLKPLHNTLTKLGLPHLPPSDEEAKNLDLPKIAGLAIRSFGIPMFFTMGVDQDLTNSTKNQLKMIQKSPAWENFDTYVRQPILFKSILRALTNNAKSMFVVGGAGDKSEEYTTELMGFMTKIAKIMGTPAARVSANYSSSVATIDKLQEMTDPHGDTWNWMKFFTALCEQTDITVDPKTDTVLLHDFNYAKKLILLIKETPVGTIARYFWWEIYFTYWNIMYNSFSKSPRWQVCMNAVKERFEAALTAAYVEKHFDVQYKKKALEMWADLNSTLDEMIDTLDWMDPETKAHAHIKLHAVRPNIGYPDWITKPEELNKYYEPFEVFEGRLFDTIMQYRLIQTKRLMNGWKQMPDKNMWTIAGTAMDIIYERKRNAVEMAAAVLHFPLYGNGVESLNYGAVGALLGSQLIQAVDDQGGETDQNGNFRRWWSEKTLKPYLEKVSCIMQQYSDLLITHQGHNFQLNALKIYQGSIANIAGLKIAFRAYQKFKARSGPQQVLPALDKYTDEQLLFLGYAQVFCESQTAVGLKHFIATNSYPPNRYRVIGALQNSDEFAKAWNCSHDSPMNRNKTCTTIW